MYSHDFFDYNGETRSLSYRYYRGSKMFACLKEQFGFYLSLFFFYVDFLLNRIRRIFP